MTTTDAVATKQRIDVHDGTVLLVDVLRWHEGWDFDCPVCILRPVIRFSPNGEQADQMVEDLCVNASVDGYIESEGTEGGLIDRQFPFVRLRRQWSKARSGHASPVKVYTATRFRVSFFLDADGLSFNMAEVPS